MPAIWLSWRKQEVLSAMLCGAAGCGTSPATGGRLPPDAAGSPAVAVALDAGVGATDEEGAESATAAADGGSMTGQGPDSHAGSGAADAASDGSQRGVDSAAGGDAASGGCGDIPGGGPIQTTTTHLDIGVHDPSMIWDGSRYYLFATGGTLGIRSSPDMFTWSAAGSVFAAVPAWITTALGKTPGDLWAPDVSYYSGEFHVYYAGSFFGTSNSVIGLATRANLAGGAGTSWVDRGLVLESRTGDTFNAIDPNVSFDRSCIPWLAYGSYWSGIKLRKLDGATGKLATDDPTIHSLASRGGGSIEASSIISHNGFYYLFVSFGACCQGVTSTYETRVGRATDITGPYTDKAGASMMTGAAELLLATSGRYIGPGGGTAWKNGDAYLYAFHYYDGQANGASKLQVRPIQFGADDWVTLGAPLFP